MLGIKLNQHAITHPLLETERDARAMEHIASVGGCIRPDRSHIPPIEPDLDGVDRGTYLHAIVPVSVPPVDDH